MEDRWRTGFIALTAVVVALAVASAIFSHASRAPSQSGALYTPSATPSPTPSPSPSPSRTLTLPPTPTSAPATGTPRPNTTFTPYRVEAGESLRIIATRFKVTIDAILAANPKITDPSYVQAGDTILIPPPGWVPSPSPSSS
jgi:LysM repeat protein